MTKGTFEALKKIKRTPGAVFKSSRGDRYHPHSYSKIFGKLRESSGVPVEVEFNRIRDGAFTASCKSTVDSRLANIVAGHASGMSDHYIARNPLIVKPACDAIEKDYFGNEK